MDADLLQQIYPIVKHATENVKDLKLDDRNALMADLYLGLADYKKKEIPKFLGRLNRLEDLKSKEGKLKDQKFLENIKKQQDGILEESKKMQYELLMTIYSNWLDNLEKKVA